MITTARKGNRALVVLAGMAVLISASPALARTAAEPASTATAMTAQAAPVLTAERNAIIVGSTVDVTVTGESGESVALIWSGPSTKGERIVHASVLGQNGEVTFRTRPPVPGAWTYLAQTANGRSAPVSVQVGPETPPPPMPMAPVAMVGPEELNLGDWVLVDVTGTPGDVVALYAYTRPNTTYRQVRTGILDANGRTSFAIRPGGDTRLYAKSAFGPTGPSDVVGVRYFLSFAAKQLPDNTVRFVGTAVPRRAGVPVSIYQGLGDGTRQLVGRGLTSETGQYSIPVRFPTTGTMFFVATAGGTSANRQGISKAIAVPVRAHNPAVSPGPTLDRPLPRPVPPVV